MSSFVDPFVRLVQSSVLPKVSPNHEADVILRLPVHLPPRLVFWPSCMIFNMDPHHPHHLTHLDSNCCLLLSLPSTIIPSTFWPQPKWRPPEEFFKSVTLKGLNQRSMTYCYISGIQHCHGFLTFLLFFIFKVDSKLNSDLAFKQNRNIFTI